VCVCVCLAALIGIHIQNGAASTVRNVYHTQAHKRDQSCPTSLH